jgi:hypothetical protein
MKGRQWKGFSGGIDFGQWHWQTKTQEDSKGDVKVSSWSF